MPRHACVDAPNPRHHGRVRGFERSALFRDDPDRADGVARVATVAEQGTWIVSAWRVALSTVLTRVRRRLDLTPAALAGGRRGTALPHARAVIAYLWVEVLGDPGRRRRHFASRRPGSGPRLGDADRVGSALEAITCILGNADTGMTLDDESYRAAVVVTVAANIQATEGGAVW
jgi:hypothetical protein